MTEEYKNIVVIDDSTASLALYARGVDALAVSLVSFQSIVEGYAHLQQHHADIIFLSNLIQGMDGLELLKRIQALEHLSETPVIVLSSKDYDQDRLMAQEMGAQEYLVKPVPAATIREIITKYTGAQARDE